MSDLVGNRTTARLANDAWEALLTAHSAVLKELAADNIWQDLSMREYDVLYTLSKCPEAVRLTELHRHVLMSQPALSRMVHRLSEQGLVIRTNDPDDKRSVRLALTEAGRAAQKRVGGRHAVKVAREITTRLTAKELQQLELICRKLADE